MPSKQHFGLVFENVAVSLKVKCLQQCLEAIAQDSDATILRVTKRLHPAYDAEQTAGYRDLQVAK